MLHPTMLDDVGPTCWFRFGHMKSSVFDLGLTPSLHLHLTLTVSNQYLFGLVVFTAHIFYVTKGHDHLNLLAYCYFVTNCHQ